MEGVPQKIALFIDADNVSSRYGKLIMDNLEKRGEVFIRRIYGNWEKTAIRKWDDFILCYGLRTVHQIDFVTGKNATDMALAIDVMDVLHKNPDVKTFAIVSNDSDFTPLAVRLREYGISLIGIGMRDSSFSFKSACSEFISMESLSDEEKIETAPVVADEQPKIETPVTTITDDEKIMALERKIEELERKVASPKWGVAFQLTTEENKNSALKGSTGKIKQKIICKTFTPSIVETDVKVEDVTTPTVEINAKVEDTAPPIEKPVEAKEQSKSDLTLEIVSIETKPSPVEVPADVKSVVVLKPTNPPVKVQADQPAKAAKKKGTVELKKVNTPSTQTETAKIPAVVDDERARALQQRFVECGMKGMKNPKKKLQQIHDALQESARLHGDKNGFVPLNFAGQDLKKKNLGFGIKDFGYNLLNEFISDFPDLYELTRNKPRSFRYRCI